MNVKKVWKLQWQVNQRFYNHKEELLELQDEIELNGPHFHEGTFLQQL